MPQTLGQFGVINTAPVVTNPQMLDRESREMFADMSRQVDTLYKWHDVDDTSGVKLWYGRTLNASLPNEGLPAGRAW